MIGNIKKNFLAKNWYVEKTSFAKIQIMSKTLRMHAACSLQNNVEDVEDIKNIKD